MPSIALQNTISLTAAIFQHNPLPSFLIEAGTLQITLANSKAASLLQYSTATLQSFTWPELLEPADRAAFEACGLQNRAEGTGYAFKLLKGTGGTVTLNLFISPFNHGGQLYYQLVGAPADGGQKETVTPPCTSNTKLLASLVEETEDILNATGLDFKPITWNSAAERIYGVTAAEAIGADIGRLLQFTYTGTTREQVRQVIKQEGYWRGELVFTRPTDGRQVTLLLSFKKLLNDAHQHVGYLVCGTDITRRKEDELRLSEMENRFRNLADAAPVGIWVSDTANRLIYVNKTLLSYVGKQAAEFNNAVWATLLHPDDVERTKAKFKKHFWKKKPATLVYRFQKNNGEYRWVQDTGLPRYLQDGTFIGYIGSIIDINDTKKREEQLQYQALILQSVQDIVVTTDLQFHVSSWNKAAEKVYGYTRAIAMGRHLSGLLNFDFIATTEDAARQELFASGLWKGEVNYKDATGEEKCFLHTISFLLNNEGERTGIMIIGQDVTDRKKAEARLQQSELFYRNLIADSLDGILLCDTSGTITFVAPSVKNILGYEAQDILGHNAFEFVHAEDLGWALQSFEKEVGENPEIKSIVVRLLKKDGNWLWCMVRGNNLLANPHINSIVIYFHDDTLRKQASQALKESEKRFRSLISELQVGVILKSPEGKTIMCNKTTCQLLMVSEEELTGKSIYEVLSDDFIDESGAYMPVENRPLSQAIQTKEVMKDRVVGFRQRTTNERVWVMINADPILDEKGQIQHIICTLKDITDRKKLDEALLAEKIGHQRELTQATIDGQEKERREIGKELHDNIGQQLTTTKLFLDMAKNTADEQTAEMVSLALKGISDVINEIRSISHALVPPILGDIGIIESIEAMLDSIRYVQLLKIDFDYFDFNEDRVPENVQLMLYRIIQEGMNNIVKHADATRVSIVMKNINRQLTLELKDNGKGFKVAKVRKGLGLTNIKNRAELFGGNVIIDSTPGGGCSLKVVIPDIAMPAAN